MDIFTQTKIQKQESETDKYYEHIQILFKALESVNYLKSSNVNLGEFWALSQASIALGDFLKDKPPF